MNTSPSCSIDEKGQAKFVDFDPYADAAATVALLQKEKAQLERKPGSKARSKKLRVLESLIAQFSANAPISTGPQRTDRKDKAIFRKLRRKAARVDEMRKIPFARSELNEFIHNTLTDPRGEIRAKSEEVEGRN